MAKQPSSCIAGRRSTTHEPHSASRWTGKEQPSSRNAVALPLRCEGPCFYSKRIAALLPRSRCAKKNRRCSSSIHLTKRSNSGVGCLRADQSDVNPKEVARDLDETLQYWRNG